MERHEKHQVLLGWQWFGFVGKYPIDKILHKRLRKYSVSASEIKTILVHKRPICIIDEELNVKKIAYQIQQKKINKVDLAKKLNTHLKKFGHVVVYDETNDPMDLQFIKKRIEEHIGNKNLGDEINKIYLQFKKNRKEFQDLISKYKFNKNDLDLIIFSSEFAHFTELRNQFRALAAVYSRDLFEILAKRVNLNIQELLCFTDYEINDALLGKIVISQQEAKSRYKYSVVISSKYDYLILTGKDARKVNDLVAKKYKTLKIKGKSTYRGVAVGKVRIVIDKKDVGKIKRGDILVSPMTLPVFLLAMKKTAAIVTDEGGILCHAAVISRELKIPCVVGTKIATKILKDGDMVEVDAEKGIVKILS